MNDNNNRFRMVHKRTSGMVRSSPNSGSSNGGEFQDDDCVMVELDLLAEELANTAGIRPGTIGSTSSIRNMDSAREILEDDGDTYVDDLYNEYKASVAASSNKKARYRFRRRMRTLLCIGSVIFVITMIIVWIKKATYVPPTMAPTVQPTHFPTHSPTNKPTEQPTKAPVPYTHMPTTSQLMTAVTGVIDVKRSYMVNERAATQIGNYRLGDALIINIHITHHAGTSLCSSIGFAPSAGQNKTPSFVCWKTQPGVDKIPSNYPQGYPWKKEDTTHNLEIVRSAFHYVSWEFRYAPSKIQIRDTEWENPNIVSVLIIRHPMNRLLSADGIMSREYPNIFVYENATVDEWWKFAKSDYTNNYALRILAGPDNTRQYRIDKDKWCCNGTNTNLIHLDAAKALIRRFTFVLDIDCLKDGIDAVANILNITQLGKYRSGGTKHPNETIKERINNSDIYNYLYEKNKLDIELYEWAKRSRVLVKCSSA